MQNEQNGTGGAQRRMKMNESGLRVKNIMWPFSIQLTNGMTISNNRLKHEQ